jgi:hypothetical protein
VKEDYLIGFIVGLIVSLMIFVTAIIIGDDLCDISYSHSQIDIYNDRAEINTSVYGLEYPGGYTYAGGPGEKLSFSELLNQSKRDFHRYHWFEQVNVNDSLDIRKIEIKLWFRNNKVGTTRK